MGSKVGDLSRTMSESLGGLSRKWGIPAIPRPRINTDRVHIFVLNVDINLTLLQTKLKPRLYI